MAKRHLRAISHDDAKLNEIVVDGLSIGHLGKEEVSIRWINFLADGQQIEGINHAGTLLQEDVHSLLRLYWFAQSLGGLLLG